MREIKYVMFILKEWHHWYHWYMHFSSYELVVPLVALVIDMYTAKYWERTMFPVMSFHCVDAETA